MKLLRTMPLAMISVALFWEACTADEPAASAARDAAEASENSAINSRDQAEWMRDDALGLKASALSTREQCVTAGASMTQLDPGDNAVGTGDLKKAVGASDYADASDLDSHGQDQMVLGLAYFNEDNWGAATTAYTTAETKFDAAIVDYDDATSGGYYEAYEWYDTAFERFDELLMFLM